jgi:thiazole synthase
MGADAVLVNSAIAQAKDPVLMAQAFKRGVEAGRMAFLAGRISRREYAVPSSPTQDVPQPTAAS